MLAHAKSATLGPPNQMGMLVGRLRGGEISPLLSACVVEVLEAVLCEPLSETTDDRTYYEALRQVGGRVVIGRLGCRVAGVFVSGLGCWI